MTVSVALRGGLVEQCTNTMLDGTVVWAEGLVFQGELMLIGD